MDGGNQPDVQGRQKTFVFGGVVLREVGAHPLGEDA